MAVGEMLALLILAGAFGMLPYLLSLWVGK